ncbi:PREDICTED: uncharacterized protein LOC106792387 [Polistes canadensis]|uniref:uncharacterized protein LOC106792387 n=1 Tax=Polistes canadensis TaxID=91411 RepID=UPI000718E01E|nr:PREDICTED: uncharacterized protein LOC106792387 [Polistes canadensis]
MAGDKIVPCPEFQFSTTACHICNGYYGPCFEEPVCATCHAFLFPNDIGLFQVPIFSEKTDDEDSGNDEPTDLFYSHERRTSQQQQNSPQNVNNSNVSNNHNVPINNVNNFPNVEAFQVDYVQNLEHVPPFQHCQDNNCRQYEEVGEPSSPYNLSERLEILTNPKHIEHEPINEPGLVESLPPEVLLAVFSHLDDVSLWSAANVCRRWCGLLSTHVTSQQWQQNVKMRWPLYRPIGCVNNWYKVYDQLASSAPCRTCLAQTSLRTRAPRMEEYYWRRNRLLSELKSLRMDPPEGIEATPLDQMCCHWQATITGPVGSPYEGGLFYLYLQVPYSYPMCPPVVRFLTKILHPNVSRHGDVGIDSIHHNWSLALTISKVLISVQSLLTDPYCQVCMEPELGEMYMNDREKFEEVARAWTWRYAMHDVITPS